MIVCARCHHENPDGTLLCETCRTYLGWATPSPTAAPAPAVAPEDADPGPATPTREPAPTAPEPAPTAPEPARSAPLAPTPSGAPATVAPGAPRAPEPITVRAAGGPGARTPVTPVAVPAAPSGRPAPAVAPPVANPRAATGTPAPPTTPPPVTPEPEPPARRPPTTVRPVPVVLRPTEAAADSRDRPSPREAPERSIGVRVAAGEARIAPRAPTDPDHPAGAPAPPDAFGALQPTEAGAYGGEPAERARPDQPASDPSWQSFEDATRCPSCGRALAVSRRFCRCGATLVRAAPPEDEPVAPREPWYRRWLGGFRRGQGFWRRMRMANNGVRAHYDQARSAQVHLAEVTALLAALGITAVFVLPSTSQVEAEVVARVSGLDPRGYSAIEDVTATTDPESPPETGFDPAYATDGTTGRAWAGVWTPPTDAGPVCRRPGGTPALVLTPPAPAVVDRIAFSVGMPESSPDRAVQDLPRRIDVSWGDGPDQCEEITLTDSPELQSFPLDATDVTSVRIVVVDVYDAQDPPEVRRIAFNEVLLLQQGAPPPPEPTD